MERAGMRAIIVSSVLPAQTAQDSLAIGPRIRYYTANVGGIKGVMDAQAQAVNPDNPSHISAKQRERQADPKSSGLEGK
jgi:hypothetical protein